MANLVVGMFLLALSALVQPTRASCPRGWWVNGVRPSGITECFPVPPEDHGCAGSAPCPDHPSVPGLPMRVYCAEGTQPIAVDERTVVCKKVPHG